MHAQNATVHAKHSNIQAQQAILLAQYLIMHAQHVLYQHVFAVCQHACTKCQHGCTIYHPASTMHAQNANMHIQYTNMQYACATSTSLIMCMREVHPHYLPPSTALRSMLMDEPTRDLISVQNQPFCNSTLWRELGMRLVLEHEQA